MSCMSSLIAFTQRYQSNALDHYWMQRLRHAGLGGIGGGEEPVRAAVLLKIGDLVVGQLDVVLALPQVAACAPANTGR